MIVELVRKKIFDVNFDVGIPVPRTLFVNHLAHNLCDSCPPVIVQLFTKQLPHQLSRQFLEEHQKIFSFSKKFQRTSDPVSTRKFSICFFCRSNYCELPHVVLHATKAKHTHVDTRVFTYCNSWCVCGPVYILC